ncbi:MULTISPECIES: hypothetical protein [unclassified Exiguobacterium]|uniref:hypothetical protein n=1 Tax=unclassified Exiguobacterium TaxID=2644629 RepID=UPI000EDFF099|nr:MULTISPECIES: hypothetical protein [unclassified Exiguobacterium]MDX1259502.1 hypothetical protein [Exiguobacterium sp. K1]HCN57758.1 hypothetical protein [Exiguobacterium sp.]
MLKGMLKYAVLVSLMTSTLVINPVEAATKQEKQVTTAFTKYKTGMTITEFAKQRYGKTYKNQLTKKNGRTVLKEKSPKQDTSEQMDFLYYMIYDKKTGDSKNYMTFFFTVKPKGKVYRLALKSLDFRGENPMGVRQSDKQLKRGKQIKNGMTEQQLDKVLIGEGLGDWMTWSVADFSHTLSKRDMERMGLGQGKGRGKVYLFRTNHPNERLRIEMAFDLDKKNYRVSGAETFSSDQELD